MPLFLCLSCWLHAGGHLGWVGGRGGLLGAPWTDDVMLDFFDAQLAQLTTKAGQESQTQQQELNS
jgi:hypothetical protein